jgi:hypothetical protein
VSASPSSFIIGLGSDITAITQDDDLVVNKSSELEVTAVQITDSLDIVTPQADSLFPPARNLEDDITVKG